MGVQGKDQYCSCSDDIELRASQSLSISFYKADVGGNVKLRDMDEKHMHNLFLKNMSGLIEETKNPSPCMNP